MWDLSLPDQIYVPDVLPSFDIRKSSDLLLFALFPGFIEPDRRHLVFALFGCLFLFIADIKSKF